MVDLGLQASILRKRGIINSVEFTITQSAMELHWHNDFPLLLLNTKDPHYWLRNTIQPVKNELCPTSQSFKVSTVELQ
jgi:hypothetical protein